MKTIWSWQSNIVTASEGNKRSKLVVKEYRLKNGTKLKIKKRKAEHWREANERHQEQKRKIKEVLLKEKPQIAIPCAIVLTRIAPRSLDVHDNLRMSMKWIVDAIADYIIPGKAAGRADDCELITWEYKQRKGKPREYGVNIEISYDTTH